MEAQNAHVQLQDGIAFVRLSGQIRVDSAEDLRQQLLRTEITKELVLDWADAEHVDGSVLQVLIANKQVLSARGIPILVARDNAGVREFLRVSGLSEYFPLKSPLMPSAQESNG